MGQGQGRQYRVAVVAALLFSSCGGALGGPRELAVKYVAYRGASLAPVVTQLETEGNVDAVNAIWAPCGVRFVLEDYEAVEPATVDLNFDPRDLTELFGIRSAFGVSNQLLIVTTGKWDRSGTLGSSTANAWTTMPAPDGPFGVVMEEPVAEFSALIAHELGHYLGLVHVSDQTDVMHAIIYSSSKTLTADQCATARSTIDVYWQPALR